MGLGDQRQIPKAGNDLNVPSRIFGEGLSVLVVEVVIAFIEVGVGILVEIAQGERGHQENFVIAST